MDENGEDDEARMFCSKRVTSANVTSLNVEDSEKDDLITKRNSSDHFDVELVEFENCSPVREHREDQKEEAGFQAKWLGTSQSSEET